MQAAVGGRKRAGGLLIVLACAVLGAALALVGTVFVWLTQKYGSDFAHSLSRKGYQDNGSIVPLALVALAGLAASFAVRGWLRRLVGVLIGAVGIGLVVVAIDAVTDLPADATSGDVGLPAAANLMGPVRTHPVGPAMVIAGGLLVLAAGIGVVVGAGRRRMGVRYDAPAATRAAVRAGQVSADVRDADAAAQWWKALDAGADPTTDQGNPGEGVQPQRGRRLP